MLDKKKIAIIVGGATVVVSGATALALHFKKKAKGSWGDLGADLPDADFDDLDVANDDFLEEENLDVEDYDEEDYDDEDYDDDYDGVVDETHEKGCPFDEDIYANKGEETKVTAGKKSFKKDTPKAFTHLLKDCGVKDEKLLTDIEKAVDAFGTATEKTYEASKAVLIKGLKKALEALEK